jgi:hypothetical protein
MIVELLYYQPRVKKRSFLRLSDKIKISSALLFDGLYRKGEGKKELALFALRGSE